MTAVRAAPQPARKAVADRTDRPSIDGDPPRTPDGRYLVVRGRLWRLSDPGLSDVQRAKLVRKLMRARRDIAAARRTDDPDLARRARRRVHEAKIGLGERGPVWWTDGTPDYNRHLVRNTPYAAWHERFERGGAKRGRSGPP